MGQRLMVLEVFPHLSSAMILQRAADSDAVPWSGPLQPPKNRKKKKKRENNPWKRDLWGNQFGWQYVVRGSRDPSPGDSGWDLESGKLPKKGWSFPTGFTGLGKRCASGGDPRCTTRGAITTTVITALMSPETRRRPLYRGVASVLQPPGCTVPNASGPGAQELGI